MASLTRSSASIMDSGGLGACTRLGAVGAVGSAAALVAVCPACGISGTVLSLAVVPSTMVHSVADTISLAFWGGPPSDGRSARPAERTQCLMGCGVPYVV
jgi:hypothetical protein